MSIVAQRLYRVLIVDDSATTAAMIAGCLRDGELWKFEVDFATDLETAKLMVRSRTFDVLLLDLELPDATQLQAVEHFAAEHPEIPLVVITGSHDMGMAIEAIRKGAQDYLLKPDDMEGTAISRSVHYSAERHRLRYAMQQRLEKLRTSLDGLEALMKGPAEVAKALDMTESTRSDSLQKLISAREELCELNRSLTK